MVQWRNTAERYGIVTIVLHWLGAASVLAMLGSAAAILLAPTDGDEGARIQLHASIGMVIYAVIVVRVLWHAIETRPVLLSGSKKEKTAARLMHRTLLLLLLLQLMSGPVNVWSGGWPVSAFGLFTIPSPFDGPQSWHDAMGQFHSLTGYALALLVLLHIAAAIRHQFHHRDGTLRRMAGLAPR